MLWNVRSQSETVKHLDIICSFTSEIAKKKDKTRMYSQLAVEMGSETFFSRSYCYTV